MRNRLGPAVLVLALWLFGSPAVSAQGAKPSDDEPAFWPMVRYDRPTKLAVGVLIQPPFEGGLDPLLGMVTIATGGYKVGVGVGRFGGTLAAGQAVQLTVTRTFAHPHGADPHQTFVGVEGSFTIANLGVRIGPAVRVGGRHPSDDRFRMNVSVGWGF